MSRNGLVRRDGSKPAGISLIASLTVPRTAPAPVRAGMFVMIVAIITFPGGVWGTRVLLPGHPGGVR
jgi:hypothetical protein